MTKPTGKLAFAYATIQKLEARIAELEQGPDFASPLLLRQALELMLYMRSVASFERDEEIDKLCKELMTSTRQVSDDGWLQDGALLYRLTASHRPYNSDEIWVDMFKGSRSKEDCTRGAAELLERIRASHPAKQTPLIPFRHGCKWCGAAAGCEHQGRST